MSGEKKAFPKFVITYNEILGLIQQGLYPEESKLPPEEELALQMNVSRMTLRKSLIYNISLSGKGRFHWRPGAGTGSRD